MNVTSVGCLPDYYYGMWVAMFVIHIHGGVENSTSPYFAGASSVSVECSIDCVLRYDDLRDVIPLKAGISKEVGYTDMMRFLFEKECGTVKVSGDK